jgi:hypothetical protein
LSGAWCEPPSFPPSNKFVVCWHRVGLTLKKHDNNQPDFIMRHYRYLLKPSKIKKGKVRH